MNIWNRLLYKVVFQFNARIGNTGSTGPQNHPTSMMFGLDVRHYMPTYGDIVWAVREAEDFSWGHQKIIYYLGGVDNWLMFGDNQKNGKFRYFDPTNTPDPDNDYAYQA